MKIIELNDTQLINLTKQLNIREHQLTMIVRAEKAPVTIRSSAREQLEQVQELQALLKGGK